MRTQPLDAHWQLASTPAGACNDPASLAAMALVWTDARVPGTVAATLHTDLSQPRDYDADDWWYRTTFNGVRLHFDAAVVFPPPNTTAASKCNLTPLKVYLCFKGLATLAVVWLNGELILESRNMFVGQRVEVGSKLRDVNQLVIRFASLRRELAAKRPRPRWKTALVEDQSLRWFRTTLLGRMPGWNPRIPPVGPWRGIALEREESVELADLDLQAFAVEGRGRVLLRAAVTPLAGQALVAARLRVGEATYALRVLQGHDARIQGDIDVGEVPLWWPHTHGEPALLPCALELRLDGEWHSIACGPLGFREIALDREGGRLALRVNGIDVFCRGTCWAPIDILRLAGTREELRTALLLARDAGANMIRVSGTMCYESEDFYALCDELGLLVWQDFMFANMDYPMADAGFRADALAEARHQLLRLQRHPSIAAYCGGSEVAQQASMNGLGAAAWSNEFFDNALPALVAAHHAGVPYFPSTPWGGALPFHVGSGLAHYYGVGAYRRPLSDVKHARVKFATECLAFSNVPGPEAMAEVTGARTPPPHHPAWKARVPRDNGAGWDFEDVRDHYLRETFGLDAVMLRSRDPQRYYALSRSVTGEVMRRVFAEWRAPGSTCAGALVWLNRDPWPGAGWGIVDSAGRPKAAYWALKRAWAPLALHLTDEGLDGIAIHVVNERSQAFEGHVALELLRDCRVATARARAPLRLAPRAALTLSADALLGAFTDANHAYRFGPPGHEVVTAALLAADGTVVSEDALFPAGANLPRVSDPGLDMQCRWLDASRVEVRLEATAFLQGVHVDCDAFQPDDDHFHLSPRRERRIVFTRRTPRSDFRASFAALNTDAVACVQVAALVHRTEATP